MILCANPKAQYISHREEIDKAIKKVLESGHYILGNEVMAFEEEFAKYIGTSFAVGVGSGTEALHLALASCGVAAGDEVITVSNTAIATVAAIELCGGVPVFVDVESDSFNIDPNRIEEAITSKTKAIIPVHIYGHPAEMDPIMVVANKYGLRVIEDCAQAHGAAYLGTRGWKKCGSIGDIGCFSFYPTKNLGALGDGGMIVTDDVGLAEKARSLREYGWKKRYISESFGWNTRLDEIQAAVLRVKLKYLDKENDIRKKLASLYSAGLNGFGCIVPSERKNTFHVYHLYVMRSKIRDKLLTVLHDKGIAAAVHYPVPVHMQPVYKFRKYINKPNLVQTERLSAEILSLPMYPELRESDVARIVHEVKNISDTDCIDY
ncbi:MAG: DegT/DnrJ/EryC1/StrS family aminotransferase [Prolixibacteraceae bacterium]|nr:DegT/DnrJ/EryC1/StrS family aminotransferase [Prolixibacteraceae bacterium]